MYVNRSAGPVALVPDAVVTVTSTGLTPGGDVVETEVSLITVNVSAGDVPKLTAVAPVKLAPVIVTAVPPDGEPLVGLMLEMMGVAAEQTVANANKTAVARERISNFPFLES
jgi:hypothetical protein